MSEPLTEVRFWALVGNISRRTIICSPELESRVKGYIDARGLGGLITVRVSKIVPDDKLIVMDEGVMQAELNRSLQQETRRLFGPDCV